MKKKNADIPITKEQIDKLADEMHIARNELNQMGGELRTVSDDLLNMSNRLDEMVNRYMRIKKSYDLQNHSKK